MFFKVLFLFSTICVSSSLQETLKVTVFSEGLCPYCHEFILEQLYPGYQKLGDSLLIDLVPLGFATHTKENNKLIWYCQHGDLECYINKINACAINLKSAQSNLMGFVNCLTANSTSKNTHNVQEAIAKKCAQLNNLSWNDINSCVTSDMADNLLLGYEARQNSLVPELEYVPHVLFNYKVNATEENEAFKNFVGAACKLFKIKPKNCT